MWIRIRLGTEIGTGIRRIMLGVWPGLHVEADVVEGTPAWTALCTLCPVPMGRVRVRVSVRVRARVRVRVRVRVGVRVRVRVGARVRVLACLGVWHHEVWLARQFGGGSPPPGHGSGSGLN